MIWRGKLNLMWKLEKGISQALCLMPSRLSANLCWVLEWTNEHKAPALMSLSPQLLHGRQKCHSIHIFFFFEHLPKRFFESSEIVPAFGEFVIQWNVRANSMLSHFSCVWFCDPMDCSPPGSSVHGILWARILEWVAMPSSRGSSQPRDWTWVSYMTGSLPSEPPEKPY